MNADGDWAKQLKTTSKVTWDATTDRDAFESYAIAAATAALTAGLTDMTGLNNAAQTANTANTVANSPSLYVKFGKALVESAISTTASTAVQSAVNGEDFGNALKSQIQNIVVGAIANVAAKEIGMNYKTSEKTAIDKTIQLTSHAALGAVTAELTGNNAVSGAVSGVVGELAGQFALNHGANESTIKEIAGLAGGISAILTGELTGQDDHEIAQNIYSGSRIGRNAAENNLLYSELVEDNKNKEVYDNFGPRWKDPKTGKYYKDYKNGYQRRNNDHSGTDIGSLDGKEIYSAADGIVTRNYTSDSYGNTIIIQSTTPEGQKVWSLYAHMKNPSPLMDGTKVLEGQNIGLIGNTGKSQGNHLHFGVNTGDGNGNFNFSQGWINPETINIGEYNYLEETPAYQQKNN